VAPEEEARETNALQARQGAENAFPPSLGNAFGERRADSSSENEQDT